MSWYEVIKVKILKKVDYSGRCEKCGIFVRGGQPCPEGFSADTTNEGDIRFESCPMKVDDDAIHLE